jgi:diaminopimelate decarboxylase
VTSGGELFLAQLAGFPPEKIIFSGVGKTKNELEMAVNTNIKAVHVESFQELSLLAELSETAQRQIPVGIRLNPDVTVNTHQYISTGASTHKFGEPEERVLKLIEFAVGHDWLQPTGLSIHVGSQISELAPLLKVVKKLCSIAKRLVERGIDLDYLDVGGGFGIDYKGDGTFFENEWLKIIADQVGSAGLNLIMEPGRSIVGPAGLLLTRVIYTKKRPDRQIVIVDAGMNDLMRPALYEAYHRILPVLKPDYEPENQSQSVIDIVGPVCETADVLAKSRHLSGLEPGDLLAILDTGAYGFAMSSNYNGRVKPAEVLVDGDTFQLIRVRQNYEDLLANCPGWNDD